ncbi:Aromatic-L-amino-acid decarboxylase [Taenia solium]|eukprot:TsM_001042800 transcript=TsM_001042800 gene=TsM_001042800
MAPDQLRLLCRLINEIVLRLPDEVNRTRFEGLMQRGEMYHVEEDPLALFGMFKDVSSVTGAFNTDAQYLKYNEMGKMPDYRNWQLSFGRKFRSLKLWFVIRKFGVSGLQSYIRRHIRMAAYLESLLRADSRFEIVCTVVLGLVCFRIKNNNEMTRDLYKKIEEDGRIHVVTATLTRPNMEEVFIIRVAIVYIFTDEDTCDFAYKVISELTEKIMDKHQSNLMNGQE